MAKITSNSTDDGKAMLDKIAKVFGYDYAYVICSPCSIVLKSYELRCVFIRDGDIDTNRYGEFGHELYGEFGHELTVSVDKKPASQKSALDIFWYTMKKYAALNGFPGFYLDVKTGLICDRHRYSLKAPVETIWSKKESLEMFLIKIDLM